MTHVGEVHRARDTQLMRDVAIKVLVPGVAHDPDRLARFRREAQVLASLNDPHIAHIHGFEDSTGVPALVMELVEGPTLADRIAQGPIPARRGGRSGFGEGQGYENSKDGMVVRTVIEGKHIRRVSFVPVTRDAKNDVVMVDPSTGDGAALVGVIRNLSSATPLKIEGQEVVLLDAPRQPSKK